MQHYYLEYLIALIIIKIQGLVSLNFQNYEIGYYNTQAIRNNSTNLIGPNQPTVMKSM